MNIIEKIISFIKLPFKVIILIAIILGLLLFLPETVQQTLKLDQFILDYGKYFGICFLFCIGYIVFIFGIWVIRKINTTRGNKKLLNSIKEELKRLTQLDIYLMREFFLQGKNVIEVPIENTEFIDLYNKKILLISSSSARGYVFGTFVSVCINPIINEYITADVLQLPQGKLTKQEIAKIKSERPLFVSQIDYINNLFNFPWMHR